MQQLFGLIPQLRGLPVPPSLVGQRTTAVSQLMRASAELADQVTCFLDSPLRQFWWDHGFAAEAGLFSATLQAYDQWAAITLYVGHCWLRAYILSIDLMNAGDWLQEDSVQILHVTTMHLQLIYQRMATRMAAFVADIEAQDPAALTNYRYFTHPALHRPEDTLSLPLSPNPGLYRHTNPSVAALVASSPFAVALYVDDRFNLPVYPAVAVSAVDLAANVALAAAPPGSPILRSRDRIRLRSMLSAFRLMQRRAG